jgi:hypothetical protein
MFPHFFRRKSAHRDVRPKSLRSARPLTIECLETRTLLSAPEIVVLDGNTSITDGGATVIDFGSVARGNSGPTRSFTIRNDGDDALTISSLGLPSGFTFLSSPSATIVPRGLSTFAVQFDSDTLGTHSGNVTIASNDADENPFTFLIAGRVTLNGPVITVLDGSNPIADGRPSPIPWPGVVQGQTGTTRTFTVRNDGTQPLSIFGIAYPVGFLLTDSLVSTLAPQASDTFAIQLLSASTGTKSGPVHILSSDPDMASFDFSITGLVTAAPIPSLTIMDGDTVLENDADSAIDFGSVVKDGTGPTRTFTIRNDGTDTLTLSNLHVPAGFQVIDGLAASVAPAASDSLTLLLDTATIAARSGDVTFDSNDLQQSPFQFSISGAVVANAPEIQVFHETDEILSGSGSPFVFDSVSQGRNGSTAIFSVVNIGVQELILDGLTVPTGFKLKSSLPPSLPPNTFTVFVVELDSAVPGTKTGEITVGSNDADEDPFRIAVTGTVDAATPEIAVTQRGKKVTDGSAIPTTFGNGQIGKPGATQTFVVRNNGRGTLMLGTITLPAGFTLVEGLVEFLASHKADTFTVQLDTSAIGTYAGDISIANNDADEDPFNFSIQASVGVAPAPEITVLNGSTELQSGDANGIDFGSAPFRKKSSIVSLTIRNDGDAQLNISKVDVPVGFALAKRAPKKIAAHRTATLRLRLDTRVVGAHTGDVVVHNDDASELDFQIIVQGSVLA